MSWFIGGEYVSSEDMVCAYRERPKLHMHISRLKAELRLEKIAKYDYKQVANNLQKDIQTLKSEKQALQQEVERLKIQLNDAQVASEDLLNKSANLIDTERQRAEVAELALKNYHAGAFALRSFERDLEKARQQLEQNKKELLNGNEKENAADKFFEEDTNEAFKYYDF